jgi:hypothetical protein
MNSKSVDQITNMINAISELLKGWKNKTTTKDSFPTTADLHL